MSASETGFNPKPRSTSQGAAHGKLQNYLTTLMTTFFFVRFL